MSHFDLEVRRLEIQLADLRHHFDDAAAPILNRLEQIRRSSHSVDRELLIPKQAVRRSPGTRIPKQFY